MRKREATPNPHHAPGYEEVTPTLTAELVTDKPDDQVQQTVPPTAKRRDKADNQAHKKSVEEQTENPHRRPEA
jgi:hypothetical protein